MRDYVELVKALRCCSKIDARNNGCDSCPYEYCGNDCQNLCGCAAAAIEELLAESADLVGQVKRSQEEIRKLDKLLAAVPSDRVDYQWLNADNSVIAAMTIERFGSGWVSLSNFEIAEAYRGKGLSHKLIEFAKTKGVNNLSVDPNNSIAINLYQQHGFFLTGETDGNLYRMRLTKLPKEVQDG